MCAPIESARTKLERRIGDRAAGETSNCPAVDPPGRCLARSVDADVTGNLSRPRIKSEVTQLERAPVAIGLAQARTAEGNRLGWLGRVCPAQLEVDSRGLQSRGFGSRRRGCDVGLAPPGARRPRAAGVRANLRFENRASRPRSAGGAGGGSVGQQLVDQFEDIAEQLVLFAGGLKAISPGAGRRASAG